MSCYVGAPALRRAERHLIFACHVRADAECYVLCARVDATCSHIQPTFRCSRQCLPETTEVRRE